MMANITIEKCHLNTLKFPFLLSCCLVFPQLFGHLHQRICILFVSILWFPYVSMVKKGTVYLLNNFLGLECLFFLINPVFNFSILRRAKQEANQSFLTSWPSDMIGSVLLPNQTKGSWNHRVSSWLGFHVASHKEEKKIKGQGREGESERLIMLCTTFIYSKCPSAVWFQLGWYTLTHRRAGSQRWFTLPRMKKKQKVV